MVRWLQDYHQGVHGGHAIGVQPHPVLLCAGPGLPRGLLQGGALPFLRHHNACSLLLLGCGGLDTTRSIPFDRNDCITSSHASKTSETEAHVADRIFHHGPLFFEPHSESCGCACRPPTRTTPTTTACLWSTTTRPPRASPGNPTPSASPRTPTRLSSPCSSPAQVCCCAVICLPHALLGPGWRGAV